MRQVKEAFLRAALDLRRILVLDGIDDLNDPPCYVIHSHDLHGPLPDLVVCKSGCHPGISDWVRNGICWLSVLSGIRDEMADSLPRSEFLPPAITERGAVVGVKVGSSTFILEDKDFLTAYYRLNERAVTNTLCNTPALADNSANRTFGSHA
jgi:hypothetical protein